LAALIQQPGLRIIRQLINCLDKLPLIGQLSTESSDFCHIPLEEINKVLIKCQLSALKSLIKTNPVFFGFGLLVPNRLKGLAFWLGFSKLQGGIFPKMKTKTSHFAHSHLQSCIRVSGSAICQVFWQVKSESPQCLCVCVCLQRKWVNSARRKCTNKYLQMKMNKEMEAPCGSDKR